MGKCDVCGNEYESLLEIKQGDETFQFDCFECAISHLAPECKVCGVKIIGHGVQAEGEVYCCAHCARKDGYEKIVDRLEHADAS